MPDPATHAETTPPESATDGRSPVELLRWPSQDNPRRLLASLARPRLLLLAPDAPPPTLLDDLELWVPDGSDASLIAAAVTALQHKVLIDHTEPVLDDDGLLWFRGRWVAVPDAQIPVIGLLVEHYKRLVHNDDLSRAYHHGGGSNTPASVRALIVRVGQRLATIGLKLHVVRRRGVLLTADEPHTSP
jgi:hypothetical protein